jgi:hypothetical protein
MCCQTPQHHALMMPHVSSSCCCFPRQFVSQQEHKEQLEKYREQLKNELGGVEEALKKME